MVTDILEKYNVPVPRYTSYPPANYFNEDFTQEEYREAIKASNGTGNGNLSFYLHIPFCRHLCHYCGCNSFAMQKPQVVKAYVEALHKEIDRVSELLNPNRRISQIHYGGGSPTALPIRYLKELNAHLLSNFKTIEDPEIAIECHPGYLTEEDWLDLTETGFNRYSLGVQDFNTKVLKTVNRRPALLPMETIFSVLRGTGARINLDFIYGLPFQSAASFGETIEKAIDLEPDRLVTFSYAHVPWVNKQQLILEKAGLPSTEEKSKMFEQASGLLHEAGYRSIGLDHFVRPEDELYTALHDHKLHRNFQGYCTRRTTGQVFAFGVTGISQLNSAYAQNSKEISTYMARIDAGELATCKGYALNEDEQIAREIIESLMCNYSIDWKELSARLSLPIETLKQATSYCENQLLNFANDGLITYNEEGLQMTKEGTLFVRNVAASLDKLMLHNTKSFSKPV